MSNENSDFLCITCAQHLENRAQAYKHIRIHYGLFIKPEDTFVDDDGKKTPLEKKFLVELWL